MKKMFLLVVLLLCVAFNKNLYSEENTPATSLSLSIFQDPSFGFYPYVFGSIGLNETTDFTFYGTFWTQDALAGYNGGINLMTEFGVGVAFKLLDGALVLNPAIGLGNGIFQSGGGNRPLIGDNIVPQLAFSYSNGDLGLTGGVIYWKHLREESYNTAKIDLFEYNLQCDYGLSRFTRLGLYYDHLMQSWTKDPIKSPIDDKVIGFNEDKTFTTYLWVGPMVKFNVKGHTFWFTTGVDLVDYLNSSLEKDERHIKDFYKMGFTINL